jgi:hypothetical protein
VFSNVLVPYRQDTRLGQKCKEKGVRKMYEKVFIVLKAYIVIELSISLNFPLLMTETTFSDAIEKVMISNGYYAPLSLIYKEFEKYREKT